MLWVNIRRILRSGLVSFTRNSFVSLASIFVMTMTLTIIGSLMFLNTVVDQFITYVEEKVDVNVYFTPMASNEVIQNLTNEIKNLHEVSYVEFTSEDDALLQFRERHRDDQLTIQALDELGENPFGAVLSIKAKEPSQYAGIAEYLSERQNSSPSESFIDSVNYARNKTVIDQLE